GFVLSPERSRLAVRVCTTGGHHAPHRRFQRLGAGRDDPPASRLDAALLLQTLRARHRTTPRAAGAAGHRRARIGGSAETLPLIFPRGPTRRNVAAQVREVVSPNLFHVFFTTK